MRSRGSYSHLAGLKPSSHACLVYGSDEERTGALTEYLAAGIDDGDKLLYFSDPDDPNPETLLTSMGFATGELLRSGRLELLPSATPARDPSIAGLGESVRTLAARAAEEGYRTLRAAGETWALERELDATGIAGYEVLADEVIEGHRAIALCCYDARRTHKDTLAAAAGIHRIRAGLDANRHPLLSVSHSQNGTTVVTGEADASNISLFEALRFVAEASQADVRLDVSALTFIDVTAIRSLARLATACARRGGSLTIEGARAAVRRHLSILGDVPGLFVR